MSVVRRVSCVVVRRQQFPLNDNFSFTTWPILTNIQRNVPKLTLYKIAKRNLIPQKHGRQGAWLIEVTKKLKIFSSETGGQNSN